MIIHISISSLALIWKFKCLFSVTVYVYSCKYMQINEYMWHLCRHCKCICLCNSESFLRLGRLTSLIPIHTNTSPNLWTRNLTSSASCRLSFYKIFISFFCISCPCQLMYAALQFLKLFHMSLENHRGSSTNITSSFFSLNISLTFLVEMKLGSHLGHCCSCSLQGISVFF